MPFSSPLRQAFSAREMRAWAELMLEKGIRIRIPFERYFDPHVEVEEALLQLPEDEEPEEDELQFLRDRQDLKPY